MLHFRISKHCLQMKEFIMMQVKTWNTIWRLFCRCSLFKKIETKIKIKQANKNIPLQSLIFPKAVKHCLRSFSATDLGSPSKYSFIQLKLENHKINQNDLQFCQINIQYALTTSNTTVLKREKKGDSMVI